MSILSGTAKIAARMLLDHPGRTALSTLGVTLAVLIMFMELGFFNGANDSSANLPGLLACDLVMSHHAKTHLKTGEEFHRLLLDPLRGVPGVERAVPLYAGAGYWWNPADTSRHRAYLLGVDPVHRPTFLGRDLRALLDGSPVVEVTVQPDHVMARCGAAGVRVPVERRDPDRDPAAAAADDSLPAGAGAGPHWWIPAGVLDIGLGSDDADPGPGPDHDLDMVRAIVAASWAISDAGFTIVGPADVHAADR